MPFPARSFPDDVPELTADGVRLRAHREEDATGVVEQCTDPRSVRWTTVPLGYDEAMARDWIEGPVGRSWTVGSAQVFAVEAGHHDGRHGFAGTVELRWVDERRAELAFGSHPGVRGTGAMLTATRLLVDHAFDTLGLESLVWWTEAGNWGSRRLAWDLGFRIAAGVVPRWLDTREGLADAWVGTLHRDDPRVPDRAVPTLQAGRLVLRPHRRADDVRVARACADPTSQHWLPFLPSPYTRQDAAQFRHATQTGVFTDRLVWAVSEGVPGEVLATVTLMDRGHVGHEVGYWAHPDARGRGVVSGAVRGLVDRALTPTDQGGFGALRVQLRAAEGNLASVRVASAAGFAPCGRESGSVALRDGTRIDHLVFERTAA